MTTFRTCPDCAATLTTADHEGVPIDSCPVGHGSWLDRGELLQVAQRDADARPEAEQVAELRAASSATHFSDVMRTIQSESTRPCPVCRTVMRKQEYAGTSAVVIDSCAEHGVWLDTGELQRIEAYAEGIRSELARLVAAPS